MKSKKIGETPESNIFETSDLDLAAFLALEGLEYLGNRVVHDKDSRRKAKAIMRFKDELGQALDFERLYLRSREKQYRDIHKYFLKQAHQAVKSVQLAAFELTDEEQE